MIKWNSHIEQLSSLLEELVFTDDKEEILSTEKGFNSWNNLAINAKNNSSTVYFIGNGASASMASHFAADLAKNAQMHTQVFSDLSLITAISNDLRFDEVFAEPLRRRGQRGDMLIAISSSGNSSNIINAIHVAKEKGMDVVTLSAMSTSNKARGLGTLNVYIPAMTYGNAESCHAAILHFWIDQVIETGRKE